MEFLGATVRVWRIGPGRFKYHDELMARMRELGVDWQETAVHPGHVSNPMVGSPAISQAWAEVAASGDLPDLVWEEGGRLTAAEKEFPKAQVLTRNCNILYYMNSVTMYAPKAARGHEAARRLMLSFDDVRKDTDAWCARFPTTSIVDPAARASLREKFISAAESIVRGDAESLQALCHSRSNYHRQEHAAQFKKLKNLTDTVVRASPVCMWASASVAIVTGIVSLDAPDVFGNKDMLSFWLKEDGDWKLLSMTDDPTNTETEAIENLANWAVEYLAPFQAASEAAEGAPVASRLEKQNTGGRFSDWCWQPADVGEPFVQIAEFHYGQSSRLFCKGSAAEDCSVSEGELWTTRSMWTLRIWTLQKGGLTISEGVDFEH